VALAGSASAAAASAASTVPSSDMAKVSAVAASTLRTKGAATSGGKNSPTKRPMLRAASIDRNCAHCKSSDQKLASTSSTSAALNQQALQRASKIGGGSR
jgi:hypothetical protein